MDRLPSSAARVGDFASRRAARANLPAGALGPILSSFRARVISGLIFSLPIVITFWIVYWLFMTLETIPAQSAGRPDQPDPRLDEELPRPPGARPARVVVQHRLARAGDRAGARDPLLPGPHLPVLGLPHARVVSASRPHRRHDLQGRPQRGRVAGKPASRRGRIQARGAGRVSSSRHAFARAW